MCRPFPFSGIMLCRQYADEQQSAEAFEQIAALVETEPAPADTPPETEPLPELTAFEKYRAVQEQNSDFLGWLSILGTEHRLSRDADRGRAEFLSETGL
ncbi:MAG: hypothetical protein ACLTZI_00245 [[Eubacterium] siraeum]